MATMPNSDADLGARALPRGQLWRKVAAALREDIRTGKLALGSQIMTELELSSRFGVSRFTTRRALSELEKEGLVRIEHGRGMFVAEDAIAYAVTERTRWTENMARASVESQRHILASAIEMADATTRRQLDLPRGAEVVVIESMGEVNGRPVSLGRNFFPADRFRGIDDLLRVDPSRTTAYRSFGILDYRRKSTRIIARLPTVHEALTLKIPKSRPILEVHKVDVDMDDRPISYGIGCYNADRIQLVVE